MEEICSKKNCTGCSACYNACPKNAIEMKEDKFGIIYPVINKEKCIDCGLCSKTCPQINPVEFSEPIAAYAMFQKDSDIRSKSTSGAAATTFYMKVLDNNGVIYGANNICNGEFKFIRITDKNELYKVKGSKYVQCYIGDCYAQAKQDLIDGKQVLFIGTPCQIAGLRCFLRKEYENLITVDLICHGVPTQKMLREELELHIDDCNKISKVTFRENEYAMKIYEGDKCIYTGRNDENYYFYRFLNGMIYRENCYTCRYAKKERVSDITIGDFWGLKSESKEFSDDSKGISVVMPNTEKGKNFVGACLNNFVYEERSVEEAVQGNTQLRHPAPRHEKFNTFMELYEKYGYEKACKKTRNIKQRIKDIKIVYYVYKRIKGR